MNKTSTETSTDNVVRLCGGAFLHAVGRSLCSLGALALLVRACHPAVICTHANPLPPRGSVLSLNHPSPLSTRNMRASPAGIASPAIGCRNTNEAPQVSFPHHPAGARHGTRCLTSHVQPISSLIRPNSRLNSLHMRGNTQTTPCALVSCYLPLSSACSLCWWQEAQVEPAISITI